MRLELDSGLDSLFHSMPRLVPQDQKSTLTINSQPKDMSKNSVQLIMLYDLSGWKQGRIAEELSMTQSRVSVIMSSPLYRTEREKRFNEMKQNVVDGTSKKAEEGDPVTKLFRANAQAMAEKKIDLALNGKSEFVQNAATNDCLEYAGYAKQKNEKKSLSASILVSDKVADRFARVLGMEIKVTTTEETSSDAA